MAERSKALQLSCRGLAGCGFESRWTGGVWVRIPLETYIFILNFSLPPRSKQVNGAVANEIKHVHSPEVIVVLDPRYDLSYKALYISTCSIALSMSHQLRIPGTQKHILPKILRKCEELLYDLYKSSYTFSLINLFSKIIIILYPHSSLRLWIWKHPAFHWQYLHALRTSPSTYHIHWRRPQSWCPVWGWTRRRIAVWTS